MCLQVKGRVIQVATSPKGSRVLQACAKYGTPEQRKALLAEIKPELVELSKSPYAHFLICKLVATATKEDIPGSLPVKQLPLPDLSSAIVPINY